MQENIQTYVRVRPLQDQERIIDIMDDKQIMIQRTTETFQFESVFNEEINNIQIFQQICTQNITNCFEGKNVCIFSYGQTSSGKTFTMKGTKESPGLIPQSIAFIFEKIKYIMRQLQTYQTLNNKTLIQEKITVKEYFYKIQVNKQPKLKKKLKIYTRKENLTENLPKLHKILNQVVPMQFLELILKFEILIKPYILF
ncbi:kinesin motor domain protein [Ichthyophthirius multifiliis]|uniref:Kinesin motor domain protein n=1 Tax=Ichthyophthirius multifiliis TaxID=5932 RepID=G0QL22_ICHMU|nr:kinesin motor domain protein [Ichthyophthirius multifiliis]EGR34078.1 kinesin motor domain protein [Ichthyophthirius multifiliis]|eukprot:XP_004039382.1 kinesin motor domain protein [Ichthyophthirius multifiliis]